LHDGGFSRRLRDDFVVPLGSSIWSADPTCFDEMPAATYVAFMANHGLLSFGDQPQWRTVTGGSRRYVDALSRPFRERIIAGHPVDKIVRRPEEIEIHTAGGERHVVDRVVVATHADQALELLSDPTDAERRVLGAIRFQANVATLHTDVALLPRRRRAWASWNYHLLDDPAGRATLTYHMNQLQSLDSRHEILVTLNREDAIDPARVLASFAYAHPVLDPAAVAAQRCRDEIQGIRGTYFCGAYWGYGFHEDGVRSAHDVGRLLGVVV
jgi:predicted NAD/FAD-binding protein